ncbi:MAG: methyltransferase domain-containing protein [Desulfobulbaceae bacterium]|jgi:predicted O-linked N-acetylglucosamine transferase (SPINDLY family)|nr:methyltransferase domain-containing protein [Desulfobulbaceae bacterium]
MTETSSDSVQATDGETKAALPAYYDNANRAILRLLPKDAATILEIGCGGGALAREYRAINPDCRYYGVEMHAPAARAATERMTKVGVGNAETFDLAELGLAPGTLDCLVYGDSLEHFIDPWQTLIRHATYLKKDGIVLACIPNVQHWSVLYRQLTGGWFYEDAGILDRTHLRFFTLQTIIDMFGRAGLHIVTAQSRPFVSEDFAELQGLFRPLLDRFGVNAEEFAKQTAALQYVVVATPAAAVAEQATAKPDQPLAARLENAVATFRDEKFDKAASLFAELAAQESENPLPPAYLALIAARQGDLAAAQNLIEHALALAPERADLPASLGETFLTCGEVALAERYLRQALDMQPDLWSAYPALAQALRLLGNGDEALSMLLLAAEQDSPTRQSIRRMVIEMLAERGDVVHHGKALRRYADTSEDTLGDLLAAACDFARFDESGEQIMDILGQVQRGLAAAGITLDGAAVTRDSAQNRPLNIAFLCADFNREGQSARLTALLRFLPPQRFYTILLNADTKPSDFAAHCELLADKILPIATLDDAAACSALKATPLDILINLDGYAPTARLALFHGAAAAAKLLWGMAPMPPIAPDCLTVVGEALTVGEMLPTLPLPGLGQCFSFSPPSNSPSPNSPPSNSPLAPAVVNTSADGPVFFCLARADQVPESAWRLFAEILRAREKASLIVNLAGLGQAARQFISGHFTAAGVEAERLRFVSAGAIDELRPLAAASDCGLAPPLTTGGPELIACLWQGRPYIAMASFLPWARRPAATLTALGLGDLVADSREDYLALTEHLPAPDPSLCEKMNAWGLGDEAAFAAHFVTAIDTLFAKQNAAREEH